MNQERKEMIIKEIKYWKQTRLLPEQYCNFLLSLYTEGEEELQTDNEQRLFLNVKSIIYFFIVQILLLFIVVVIYFTDFPILLQIFIGLICVSLITIVAKQTLQRLPQLAHFYFLLAAVSVLLIVVEVVELLTPNNRVVMSLVILGNCIIWLSVGLKFKLKYFMISGIVGLVLIVLFFLLY